MLDPLILTILDYIIFQLWSTLVLLERMRVQVGSRSEWGPSNVLAYRLMSKQDCVPCLAQYLADGCPINICSKYKCLKIWDEHRGRWANLLEHWNSSVRRFMLRYCLSLLTTSVLLEQNDSNHTFQFSLTSSLWGQSAEFD